MKDINHIPRLKAHLKQLANHKVQVGILGDAEQALKLRVNEFGAKIKQKNKVIIIPERSTLRVSFDDRKNIKKIIKKATLIFDIYENPLRILNRIGLLMTDAVRKKITSNVPPPNAPSTIIRKGSDKTLIDRGDMLRAVEYNVL